MINSFFSLDKPAGDTPFSFIVDKLVYGRRGTAILHKVSKKGRYFCGRVTLRSG